MLQLVTRLTGDTIKIKNGMGHKLGDSCKFICQFVTGYIVGFSESWSIILVILCVMPLIAASMTYVLHMMRTRSEHSQKIYAEVGTITEETLSSIRTIASLNGEQRTIDRYNAKARVVEQENITIARHYSVVFGVSFASMWFMYSASL